MSAPANIEEFGTITERDGFAAGMAALHAVRDGVRYPAGLRTQVDAQRADEYAVVLWRAGAAGCQPARDPTRAA
jgi:hypothetical protein